MMEEEMYTRAFSREDDLNGCQAMMFSLMLMVIVIVAAVVVLWPRQKPTLAPQPTQSILEQSNESR